jgi:hypothetical protein
MSRHQKSGQNQNILIGNESFENVAKLQPLGDDTKQNDIHDETKELIELTECFPPYSAQIFCLSISYYKKTED